VSRPHVLIGTWFYSDQPGFQDFRYRIESLAREFDVTLVLRGEEFRREFPDLPARIVVLDTPAGRRPMLQFIRRFSALARHTAPQLVVLLGSQLAYATFLLRGLPSVLYWNEHPTHFFIGSTRRPERVLLGRLMVAASFAAARRASLVMPIGEAHRDDLLAHGLPARRCELVYMGVEDRFAGLRAAPPAGPAERPLSVVYTGTVSNERGRDVMLEGLALARAEGAQVRLVIVGAAADQLAYCRERGAALGVAQALEVVGRVPGSEIPAYLARADLGVCIWADKVWWRFNPPTKLFEYLVAGLPVLASRIRTHTAYIRDDFNGLVFDYDARAFADALLRAWRDRAQLPAWSTAAADDGRRFLWSRIEPQFLAAVRRTMGAAA
jgi:glycosyltransferase involved in cell wall biosynthesis